MTPDDIQSEYERLGHKAGWRFMTSPRRNLATARLAIVTLNPGGERDLETTLEQRWSSEGGSAYIAESWRGQPAGTSPLQRQVQRLCQLLEEKPDDVLSGHFVPFRSKDWDSLPRRDEAALFGLKLWRWALSVSPARLIVCIGKTVAGDGIAGACGARPTSTAPSGWGNLTIDRYIAPDGRRIVALPHLSRFGLFGDAGRERLFMQAAEFGEETRPQLSDTKRAVAPKPALRAAEAAPAPIGAGQLILRGTKRPGDGTVWAIIHDRVPLAGIEATTLMAELARIPQRDLPVRVRANPSEQGLGSSKWWRGYLQGCIRRGFLVER